uniref:Uncharacterized protein n=1 Tax=Moniliophthora roreri TaxID=221103 RepID=A0A0W0FG94_MONRR
MATRRRIGVSAATTEAARRQLMQPVACWEKQWVTPDSAPARSSFKVYKWVKTEKEFNDDEGGVDEPLAPLPDEPEVVDVEDEEQEEKDNTAEQAEEVATQQTQPTEPPSRAEPEQDDVDVSKPPSPKPQLTMSSSVDDNMNNDNDTLVDSSLKPPVDDMEGDLDPKMTGEEGMELNIAGLGPDGLPLEGQHDLSQMDAADTLLGGPMMDTTMDPFTSDQSMTQ